MGVRGQGNTPATLPRGPIWTDVEKICCPHRVLNSEPNSKWRVAVLTTLFRPTQQEQQEQLLLLLLISMMIMSATSGPCHSLCFTLECTLHTNLIKGLGPELDRKSEWKHTQCSIAL